MPDRTGEDRPGRDDPDALPDDLWAAEQRTRIAAAEAAARQAQRDAEAQAARDAIEACTHCDPHGHRDGLPCPHPQPEADQRGMALIRSQMGWDIRTHADTPENRSTGHTAPGIDT